jgi:DNA repair protein RadD
LAKTPRFYQYEAHDAVVRDFNAGYNPFAALPTGTGKALLLAMLAKTLCSYSERVRVTIAAHVQELIEQNFDELKAYWPGADAGIFAAGLGEKDASHRITLASIQSAVNEPAAFGKQNIVLVDEADLVSPQEDTMYQDFFTALRLANPKMLVGGTSATPWRVKYGHVVGAGLFNKLSYDITGTKAFEALIKMKYLMRLTSKPTKFSFDVSKVRKVAGEFSQKGMQELASNPKLTEKALEEAWERGQDRMHWLLYCVGIKHIEMTHAILRHHGFESTFVHSKMKDKGQRREALEGFKLGHYRGIVSDQILTTGFNSPWVDHIVMLYSTMVARKHVQVLGRGTRPYFVGDFDLETIEGRAAAIEMGGKHDCLVSDFGTNLDRLGPINDPLIPGRKLKKGEAPIKICKADKLVHGPGCGEYNYCGARFCVECGAEFIFAEEPKIDNAASKGEAVKYSEDALEWVQVESAEYDLFQRPNSPPAMQVRYKRTIYFGVKASQLYFSELVSLDHPKPYVRHLAREWFRLRGVEPPEGDGAVFEGIEMGQNGHLLTPHWLLVEVNTRYPKIHQYSFDVDKPEVYSNVEAAA